MDYQRAMKWYQKAASIGSVDAMDNLAIMYENGQGVKKDPKIAADWRQKAAEAKGSGK